MVWSRANPSRGVGATTTVRVAAHPSVGGLLHLERCSVRRVEIVSLVKSKQRVADHGEVFTPDWMVEAMLDLVKGESERIDSRFLEPACGSGNFLVRVLSRKLVTVTHKYGKSDFEKRHHALLGLMCIYGIELLADNVAECRENMLEIFTVFLELDKDDPLRSAAAHVLSRNIVHGDALTMLDSEGTAITFAEWAYLGKGKFQRRDFRFDSLTQMSAFGEEDTLFADLGKHEVFTPTKSYKAMTVGELIA
jgi:N-6 DNA Methylase